MQHSATRHIGTHLEVGRVLGRPLEARVEPAAKRIHEAAIQDTQLTVRLQCVGQLSHYTDVPMLG